MPEFIYDDGTEPDVAKLPHCPAVDRNGYETGITCSKCKEWKVANNVNFSKKKSGKWGLERQCKKCRNIYYTLFRGG